MNTVQGLQGEVGEGGHSTSGVVVPYTELAGPDQTAGRDRGSRTTAFCRRPFLLPHSLRVLSSAAPWPSLQVLMTCACVILAWSVCVDMFIIISPSWYDDRPGKAYLKKLILVSFDGVCACAWQQDYMDACVCVCVCVCVYITILVVMIGQGKLT